MILYLFILTYFVIPFWFCPAICCAQQQQLIEMA